MTFEYWAKKYMSHDKALCDLLGDYYMVCAGESAKGHKKPKLTLQHLYEHDACQEAIDTFNRVYALYANVISSTHGRRS